MQSMGPYYQHCRQVSSQSLDSEKTCSSQSSYSDDDFGAQRIRRFQECQFYSSEELIYSQRATRWPYNCTESVESSQSPPHPIPYYYNGTMESATPLMDRLYLEANQKSRLPSKSEMAFNYSIKKDQKCWSDQVRRNNVTNVVTHSMAKEEIRLLIPDYAKPLTSVAQRVRELERLQEKSEEKTRNLGVLMEPAKKFRVQRPQKSFIESRTSNRSMIPSELNSSICDAKNTRIPPRPPKHPHLTRSIQRKTSPSPPPPLLPRTSCIATARAAMVIPSDDNDRVSRTAIRYVPRESSPELPLPPSPSDEDFCVNNDDKPLPPPPTPNQVKKILDSSKFGSFSSSSSSSIYPRDSCKGRLQSNVLVFHANCQSQPTDILVGDFESRLPSPRSKYGVFEDLGLKNQNREQTVNKLQQNQLQQSLNVSSRPKTSADYMQGLFDGIPSSRHSVTLKFRPNDSRFHQTTIKLEEPSNPINEDLGSVILRKLEILKLEQLNIQEEIIANEELGRAVATRVEELAKPNEFDKFILHVEEVNKITSLLLVLSSRLARSDNELMALTQENSMRENMNTKRDKLFEQLEEAKKLKENIDRRGLNVSNFLADYLTSEEYDDYEYYIKTKSKLLIDLRQVDDKIKLNEEHMLLLQNDLDC